MSKQGLDNAAMTVAAFLFFLIAVNVPVHTASPLPNVPVRGTISHVTATAPMAATSRGAAAKNNRHLAAGIIVVGAPGVTPPR